MLMPHSGLRWSLIRDILRVGAVAALITVQTNLTIVMATDSSDGSGSRQLPARVSNTSSSSSSLGSAARSSRLW
jgi:hypothetical protein